MPQAELELYLWATCIHRRWQGMPYLVAVSGTSSPVPIPQHSLQRRAPEWPWVPRDPPRTATPSSRGSRPDVMPPLSLQCQHQPPGSRTQRSLSPERNGFGCLNWCLYSRRRDDGGECRVFRIAILNGVIGQLHVSLRPFSSTQYLFGRRTWILSLSERRGEDC